MARGIVNVPGPQQNDDVAAKTHAAQHKTGGADPISPSDIGAAPSTHTHGKSAVGLGNVPNVATNDQTPTYTQASALANLVSGEKLSVSFGKIMKAIADLISHLGNKSNPHAVTAAQVGAAASSHTQAASTISAGTFADTGVVAKSGTDYTTARVRNIYANTTAMTAKSTSLTSGNIYLQYE